jgi:hypothetical protein
MSSPRDIRLAIVSCQCDPLTSIKFSMFLHSAKVYGHDVIWYKGTESGVVYSDFADAKVNRLLPVLERLRDDYTHVLYTDSTDAFFVASKGKILKAYEMIGFPPVLFSRERGCYPHHHLGEKIPEHLRFPNTGQYLGEIGALITMWTAVRERYSKEPDNEQGWMLKACADNVNIVLDRESTIFRADASDYNEKSWSACLLHCQGGYSDPERGKYDGMLPLFLRVLGEEPKCSA